MKTTEEEALRIVEVVKAIITDSHVVYTSGKHGSVYVNKDAIYPHTREISRLCKMIAEQFVNDDVDVVVAPAIGGVVISHCVAWHLSEMTERDVLSIYAERSERSMVLAKSYRQFKITEVENKGKYGYIEKGFSGLEDLHEGEELVKKGSTFVIKRGYDKLTTGKNILVVEDVVTTGGSVKKVIEATRVNGGKVVGLGVLCNRGGITPQDVANPPKFFALVNVTLDAWDEAECPLCANNVPINIDVGKGKDFLARKKVD